MKKFFSRFQYNSPVILTFALLSAASLLLNFLTNGATNRLIFSVYRSRLLDPMQYVRLFTYVLGHADYSHFLGNFTIILLVGPMLEEKYGSKPLLEMMVITAVVTGLIQIVFFPHTALLGASGIAFMLILLSSFTNFRRGRIPVTLVLVAVIYLSGEVIAAVRNPGDDISQMGHIIGGLCGTLFGWAITKEAPAQEQDSLLIP